MTTEENMSDKTLVVHSLKVLNSITGGNVDVIKDTVNTLQNAQTTLAARANDYWSALANDGIITPEEKKALYKEWKHLVQEYADLVNEAENDRGIPLSSDALINFKQAYVAIYTLVEGQLHLFDYMQQQTRLADRDAFIDTYTAYYTARDALRDAIRDGEDAKVRADAARMFQEAQDYIDTVSLGGLAASSVDYEKYQSGLEQRLAESDSRLSMLVQSGSTDAFMSMSVGCPYFITESRYNVWAQALKNDPSATGYLTALYEKVNISTSDEPVYAYRMRDGATAAQMKSLTKVLRAVNLLSSAITLSADMINVRGTSVFSSDTNIEKSIKDYVGESIAQLLCNPNGTAARFNGSTIVDGGFIKTDFLNVATIKALQGLFDSITVTGNSIFSGSIASGPLYIDEQNPTNLESQFTANVGDSTQAFFDQIKNSTMATLFNGTFDFKEGTDTTFTTYAFSHIQISPIIGGRTKVFFLDSKLNLIKHYWTYNGRELVTDVSQYIGNWEGSFTNITKYSTMSGALVLNKYSPTGKTLKLIDLPTSAASQSGYVYRDSEGYLRIS